MRFILDAIADTCDDVRSGKTSWPEILAWAIIFVLVAYVGLGLEVLLALVTGTPVTNAGVLYQPMVDLYQYLKYW